MLAEVKYCPCQYLFLEAVYADETFSVWLLPEKGEDTSQVRPATGEWFYTGFKKKSIE